MIRFVRALPLAAMALLLLSPALASAEEEQATDKKEEKEEKEAAEPPWEVTVDVAFGATTTDVLTGGRPTRLESPPTNVFDSTRVAATSMLFGVERHVGERLTFGVRLPLVEAELTSRTGAAEGRSAFAAGNVELEGAFVIAHGKTWSLVGTLEIALPTAGGKEPPVPAEVAAEPEKRYDYKRYDTFAAVHAGAAVRGAYESALFEPGNLGIIPKLAAKLQLGKLTISPMVKLENLFDLEGDDEVYINELVGGVRAGYRVAPAFEPGVHVWVRELHEHTHADDSFSTVAVVEPYARFHLGALQPTVSAILPFAGDLVDDKTFGIRASITGEF